MEASRTIYRAFRPRRLLRPLCIAACCSRTTANREMDPASAVLFEGVDPSKPKTYAVPSESTELQVRMPRARPPSWNRSPCSETLPNVTLHVLLCHLNSRVPTFTDRFPCIHLHSLPKSFTY